MADIITVDLEARTAVRNGTPIILRGLPVNGYSIREDPVTFADLERLYAEYRTSVPNGVRYRKPYFRAKSYDELSAAELVTGANRQSAKEALEMAILEGVLNGSLVWPDDRKWFWQSENDRTFVILRKWVKGADAA